MRYLSPLILLFAAALCFVAGYRLGQKQERTSVRASAPATQAVGFTAKDTVVVAEPVEVPEEASTSTVVAEEAVATEATLAGRHAQRAREQIITLTDIRGRSIQAEVQEVTKSYLKVRRQADQLIVEVPFEMLSQEDKAFAVYLFENREEKLQTPVRKSNDELIWEGIFGIFDSKTK